MLRRQRTTVFRDFRASVADSDEEEDLAWKPPPPPKPRIEPVRESNIRSFTRLHIAADSGQGTLVEDLLREGAFIDAQEDISERTPLHAAANKGHMEAMIALLKGGANLEAKTKAMETPLLLAVVAGRTAAVAFLLQYGADPCIVTGLYDYQIIHAAAEEGNLEIFELLVQAGANPSLKDGIGQQPFHYAATGGSVDIMKHLLTKLGSKLLKEEDKAYKRTAIHLAAKEGHAKALQLLLMVGDNQERADMAGFTPLHHAVLGDHVDAIKALMQIECNLEARDVDGKTPLHLAAATNKIDSLRLLISKGADINAKDKKSQTPMDMAEARGRAGAVRVLCSVSGAPVRDKLKMLSTTTSKLIFATNAITSTISPSTGGPPPPPKDNRPTPDHKLYPLWCKLQAIKMAEPSSSSLGVSPENSSQAPASFEQSRLSIGSIPTLPISKMRGRGRMPDEPSLGLVSIEISGQLSATASGIDASKQYCRQLPHFGQRPRTAMSLSSDPDFTDRAKHPRFSMRQDEALQSARYKNNRRLRHGGHYPVPVGGRPSSSFVQVLDYTPPGGLPSATCARSVCASCRPRTSRY